MSFAKQLRSFLNNLWDIIRQFWTVAENFIKENIHVAVVVTENFKKFVDNPVGDFLLSIIDEKIPGDVTGKVKEVLPKVLLALQLVDDCKDLSQEDTLKCIASKLQSASDQFKNAFYHSLAVTLAEQLSDGKIGFSDAIALVEWYYKNNVKK